MPAKTYLSYGQNFGKDICCRLSETCANRVVFKETIAISSVVEREGVGGGTMNMF